MAQLSISEFQAKSIIQNNWNQFLPDFQFGTKSISVSTNQKNWNQDLKKQTILNPNSLVVKPDMMFGKRAKNGLVFLKHKKLGDVDLELVSQWITTKSSCITKIYSEFDNLGEPKDTDKFKEGVLDTFIVEQFNDLKSPEYYLSFQVDYRGTIINFSDTGGVDIEENWESSVKTVIIDINQDNLPQAIKTLTSIAELQDIISGFYHLFTRLNFSYLEFNPFKVENKVIYLLDTVAKLDSVATFQMQKYWGDISFHQEFGFKHANLEVENINKLDQKSGASLKLSILNPNGKIWLLLAGGGASVVTLDTLFENLKDHTNVANYGEYSGNPTRQETYEYTKNFLQLVFRSNSEQKILFISGAIANFTDIKQTFLGIIDALEEQIINIKNQDITIYVRRGGPNYKAGLEMIKNFANKHEIPAYVNGPEISLSDACLQLIHDNQL